MLSSLLFLVLFRLVHAQDIQLLYDRKIQLILQDNLQYAPLIPEWRTTFTAGTWSDVNYTAGCDGRRANWPAQQHAIRLGAFASQSYMGGNNDLPLISAGLDYWFRNDYELDSCLDEGGLINSTCPCGTPGLWNSNWFGQMILLPRQLGNTCLLMKSQLNPFQMEGCIRILSRVLQRIDSWIYSIGFMTGANMLDAATSVLNLGLLTNNETIIQTALDHFYNQTLMTPAAGADGIKADGSYLQHDALLYTGNYGKDYINSVVNMYLQTDETKYDAPSQSKEAFTTLLSGTQWMLVYNNNPSPVTRSDILWQYSVIGRMVSFAAMDQQASGGVNINFTKVGDAVSHWGNGLVDIVDRMATVPMGQGKLTGTRSFYAADYVVHRSPEYIVTLKLYSERTSNAECVNNQNPYGFHLSDGSIFTYLEGDEYLDVFAAWDWYRVPGTTVEYGKTVLECNTTQWYGHSSFVGAVTGSHGGMAVMRYIHPITRQLQWEKTFFFFEGYYIVYIDPLISSLSTTLDQSNLKSDIYINGMPLQSANTTGTQLWHNNVLYTAYGGSLHVTTDSRPNSTWSSIGISTGESTQPIFLATLEHESPVYYVCQLNHADTTSTLDVHVFEQDDPVKGKVRAVYESEIWAIAFWTAGTYAAAEHTVTTNEPILLWMEAGEFSVADPTHQLESVSIIVCDDTYTISLPQGDAAGSSVIFLQYDLL